MPANLVFCIAHLSFVVVVAIRLLLACGGLVRLVITGTRCLIASAPALARAPTLALAPNISVIDDHQQLLSRTVTPCTVTQHHLTQIAKVMDVVVATERRCHQGSYGLKV